MGCHHEEAGGRRGDLFFDKKYYEFINGYLSDTDCHGMKFILSLPKGASQ